MKCGICGKETEDRLTIVDGNLNPSHIEVCAECLNLYANEEWEELTKRVELKEHVD